MKFLTLTGHRSITKLSSFISAKKSSTNELIDVWNDSEGYFLEKTEWIGRWKLKSRVDNLPTCGLNHGDYYYPISPVKFDIKINICVGTPMSSEAVRSEDFRKGRIPTPDELVMLYPDHNTWPSPTDDLSLKSQSVRQLEDGKILNPTWIEWLMGFPTLWSKAYYNFYTEK